MRSSDLVFGGPRTGPGRLGLPGFQLLAVQVCRRAQDIAVCTPGGGTRTCPQAAPFSPDGPSPISASPPFPDQHLWVPALWGSGKCLKAEACPLKTRHGEGGTTQKVHCFSQWEHRSEVQALRKHTLCQAQASSIIWVLHQVSSPPFGIRRRNAERQTNVQLHQIPT